MKRLSVMVMSLLPLMYTPLFEPEKKLPSMSQLLLSLAARLLNSMPMPVFVLNKELPCHKLRNSQLRIIEGLLGLGPGDRAIPAQHAEHTKAIAE